MGVTEGRVALYLTRRYAGVIWLAMVVHASQDFVILSGQVGVDPDQSVLSVLVLPTMIGLACLVWLRRRRIDPQPAPIGAPSRWRNGDGDLP